MNLSNIQKGTDDHEDDISAEENFSFESPRLSGKNGDKGRKKSFSQTQSKRQKSFISLKKRSPRPQLMWSFLLFKKK